MSFSSPVNKKIISSDSPETELAGFLAWLYKHPIVAYALLGVLSIGITRPPRAILENRLAAGMSLKKSVAPVRHVFRARSLAEFVRECINMNRTLCKGSKGHILSAAPQFAMIMAIVRGGSIVFDELEIPQKYHAITSILLASVLETSIKAIPELSAVRGANGMASANSRLLCHPGKITFPRMRLSEPRPTVFGLYPPLYSSTPTSRPVNSFPFALNLRLSIEHVPVRALPNTTVLSRFMDRTRHNLRYSWTQIGQSNVQKSTGMLGGRNILGNTSTFVLSLHLNRVHRDELNSDSFWVRTWANLKIFGKTLPITTLSGVLTALQAQFALAKQPLTIRQACRNLGWLGFGKGAVGRGAGVSLLGTTVAYLERILFPQGAPPVRPLYVFQPSSGPQQFAKMFAPETLPKTPPADDVPKQPQTFRPTLNIETTLDRFESVGLTF